MLYLLCAVLCSAAINLGFAFAKERKMNNLAVTWFNYLTAAAVSLLLLWRAGLPEGRFRLSALAGNLRGAHTADGSLTVAVLFGAVTGVIYIASLLAIQYTILRAGPSPAAMFNKLGAMLPVLAAVLLFDERPSALCWAGVAVAAAALVIYNWGGGFRFDWLLPATLLLGGLSDLSGKLFAVWSEQRFKPLFLLCVFGVAALLCTALLFRGGRPRFGVSEACTGMLVGAVNLGAAFFLILSLGALPAGIVYPAQCAGVVLLIALAGRLWFRERLGARRLAAVGLTAVSLVLLNL